MLKIDWSKVLTNAVSVLVTTVFVGAALYVWKGVESVDFRIGENFGKVKKTQKHIEAIVKVIAPKVDNNTNDIEQLKEVVNEMSEYHSKVNLGIKPKILLQHNGGKEPPLIQAIQQQLK